LFVFGHPEPLRIVWASTRSIRIFTGTAAELWEFIRLGVCDAEDDLGFFVEVDALRLGTKYRSASSIADFEAEDYVGKIEYAFAGGGERFDAVFVGAHVICAVVGLIRDRIDGHDWRRCYGLKLQMQRDGCAALQFDGIEIDCDSIEYARRRSDEMGDLAHDERTLRENDLMAVFYVVGDAGFHAIALLQACGIKFRDEPGDDCRVGRKIDRVLGDLGRCAFLRRGAECEQEEKEKTGKQKESEWFHGRWAPPGVGMNVDLQLGDSSRNPSRAVLEITGSFMSHPAW
jgi:hypothetical protein